VPRLAPADGAIAVRPFQAALNYRRMGLVWRTSFPRSEDLVALGQFIQDRLPDSVRVTREQPKAMQSARVRAC